MKGFCRGDLRLSFDYLFFDYYYQFSILFRTCVVACCCRNQLLISKMNSEISHQKFRLSWTRNAKLAKASFTFEVNAFVACRPFCFNRFSDLLGKQRQDTTCMIMKGFLSFQQGEVAGLASSENPEAKQKKSVQFHMIHQTVYAVIHRFKMRCT